MRLNVRGEFEGLRLGNALRSGRALKMVERLSRRVGQSLPAVFKDPSQLSLAYEFLKNPKVKMDELLATHFAQTQARARESSGRLLAIHDGSEMSFKGSFRREGLGKLPNDSQGFIAHTTLVAALRQECVDPLGVIAQTPLFRDEPVGRRSGAETSKAPGQESLVWMQNVAATQTRLAQVGRPVVHVMDRAGDGFRRLHELQDTAADFVIRLKYDRRVQSAGGETELLSQAFEGRPLMLKRTVTLSSRHPAELSGGNSVLKRAKSVRPASQKKAHPARKEREATLEVTAHTVMLLRPNTEQANLPWRLEVNVVRVFEPAPPEGLEPVEWLLVTSLPINTPEEVAQVVDIYRARWLIEEFHKALKSGGCEYESLQLEKRQSFITALAFFTPMAWTLLRMRALARMCPEEPATTVFTPVELQVLRAVGTMKLPEHPTVHQAMNALARYGGHLPQNGEPGYMILGRAFRELRQLSDGWRLAQAHAKPLQS